MGIKEDVLGIICKTLDVKEEEVAPDKTLYDSLGVDSTEMVELRVAINKSLEINLEGNEITNRHSPNQIIEIVAQKK
ncbi:MAG: acyl carrier protein [Candidatus Omnitrophica bacterium]|nr:acyl carrier protein [Candidatus Omnitrophota bacterium]MBU0878756.1 acyl carrier protein [Candidatus Omnitrophota bacterium]MBU0896886.1 acyl carrier protein [Candidatus Omnitrophota bacterium]MBU1134783.1 acyl carrier protein [Candidatus Omnitrophota bacterium]MBU1523994.1 acyl carrier protein [Candidatus Omnitrophota bacterium]